MDEQDEFVDPGIKLDGLGVALFALLPLMIERIAMSSPEPAKVIADLERQALEATQQIAARAPDPTVGAQTAEEAAYAIRAVFAGVVPPSAGARSH